MKRLKLLAVLLLTCLTTLLCAFALTACGSGGGGGDTNSHNLTLVSAKSATCTEDGNTAYYTCNHCIKWFDDSDATTEITNRSSVTITALGHNYSSEFTVDKAATCTEAGSKSKHCTRCDSKIDVTTINKIAHNFKDRSCTICGLEYIPSDGIEYTLSNDETYYYVSGIGSCQDLDIFIADEYNELPVVVIGYGAFRACSNLTSITIPDSVTSIGDYAFYCCGGLTSITIGNSVTSIGSDAFYWCDSLTSVYYTGDIAGWCNIAFYDRYSNPLDYANNLYINNQLVTDLVIPSSVTTIGKYAFYGCSSLTSITIPDSVTSIGSDAFHWCSHLTSVTIGNSVTSIGSDAFKNCSGLTSVYYTGDIAGWCNIKFYDFYNNPLIYAHNLYINNTLVKDLVIPDGVTSIGGWVFIGCSSLTSVTIPDSVTTIGYSAFRGCSGLTRITIPNSVTNIGNYAFFGCYKLVEVYNLSNLSITAGYDANGYVGYYALNVYTSANEESKLHMVDDYIFYEDGKTVYLMGYTGNSNEITLPNDYNGKNYSIYKYAFYYCSSLTSVTIPNSVTSIGYATFYYCSSLTSVTIGSSVTSIGYDAFWDCSGLTSVYYTGDIAEWCNITFGNVYSNPLYSAHNLYIDNQLVTDLVIPSSVTTIGNYAFFGCSSLTRITIPDSVTSIGNYAFSSCYKLVEVFNLSNLSITAGSKNNGSVAYYALNVYTATSGESKLHMVDDYIFYEDGDTVYLMGYTGNSNEITLPNDYNGKNYSIYKFAFDYCCNLTSITIPNSVTSIDVAVFSDCYNLTSVTIPNSVTSIGSDAFYRCSKLTSVYYSGTEEEWNNISISSTNNYYLTNATRYYYSENQPTKNGNWWHYVDGVPTVWTAKS